MADLDASHQGLVNVAERAGFRSGSGLNTDALCALHKHAQIALSESNTLYRMNETRFPPTHVGVSDLDKMCVCVIAWVRVETWVTRKDRKRDEQGLRVG